MFQYRCLTTGLAGTAGIPFSSVSGIFFANARLRRCLWASGIGCCCSILKIWANKYRVEFSSCGICIGVCYFVCLFLKYARYSVGAFVYLEEFCDQSFARVGLMFHLYQNVYLEFHAHFSFIYSSCVSFAFGAYPLRDNKNVLLLSGIFFGDF